MYPYQQDKCLDLAWIQEWLFGLLLPKWTFSSQERENRREIIGPEVETYLEKNCGVNIVQQIRSALR